jgi:hypothetical protein
MKNLTMHHILAIAGFSVLCTLTFISKDNNARGVLIGAASASIGFYTGSASPLSKKEE